MRTKNRYAVSFILAIFVLLSAMCFEGIKTDGLFVYVPLEQGVSCVAPDGAADDTEICTAEMLGIRNHAVIRQTACRHVNQKRESKVSLLFICAQLCGLYEGSFFNRLENVQTCVCYQEKLVTDYIHKSDGKKRA